MLTRLVSSQFRAVAMVVLPCTVLLLGCAVAHGQFVATHGKSGDGWANWLTKAHKDGYYPVYLTGYDVGGTPQFAAIALKNDGGIAWEARHGLTSDKYQQTFDDLTAKSYRPISVSGYR